MVVLSLQALLLVVTILMSGKLFIYEWYDILDNSSLKRESWCQTQRRGIEGENGEATTAGGEDSGDN